MEKHHTHQPSSAEEKRDLQKSKLLFVFALGIVITYLVSLFLPLPYSKSTRMLHQTEESVLQDMPIVDEALYGNDEGMDIGMADMDHGDMKGEMDMMTNALSGKQGAAFDKEFLSQMIVHHEGAVKMAQMAEKQASDIRVKNLAKAIIVAQQKEIADMKLWLSDIK